MRLPQTGERFLRYELVGLLGEGGFARVFDAQDDIGRRLAIKILKPTAPSEAEATAARFQREVRILGALSGPHTVRLYDFGSSPDGWLYLVFEHVPGHDLAALLNQQLLPEDAAIRVLTQLLVSLREAHQRGLLHRDLKPQNVRVFTYMGDPWRVKLLDFGIARPVRGSSQPLLTSDGELVGTPRYMSPEQLTEAELGPVSDLYSLGLVIMESLVGPHVLPGSTWGAQLERLMEGHQFDLRSISPGLGRLLSRMSARDPQRRFQSADEVLGALQALEQGSTVDRSVERPLDHSPSRGSRVLTIAGLALVFAIGIAMLALRSPAERPVRVPHLPAGVTKVARVPAERPALRAVSEPDLGVLDMAVDSGCERPPPFRGAGWFNRIDGLRADEREMYIPRSYDEANPNGLVVFLHQNFQTPRQLMVQSGFAKVAEDLRLVVLLPQDPNPLLAWGGMSAVSDMGLWVRAAQERLCIDPEHIFVIGHANGGNGAELLSCESWVKGVVALSYRSGTTQFVCRPAEPVPYLEINTTKGRRMPRNGGRGCGVPKISLAAAEARWKSRNGCKESDPKTVRTEKHGECFEWTCETPFVSCHTDGGHGWPGAVGEWEELDPLECDPPAADFPATSVIRDFLERMLSSRDR